MPRIRTKKRVTSLDIKTIAFDHHIMVMISLLFVAFLWINQSFTSFINTQTSSLITLGVALYNGYILYHDYPIKTYVLVRVGKSEFIYYQKELSSKIVKHRYASFFNHPMYRLDYIAKIKFKKDKLVRHDFLYSIKSELDLTSLGYEKFLSYDTALLNDLKSYQFNTMYIKGSRIKIKRIT
jgi:hypothetical protein